jgi:hypothetical protein
VKTLLLSLILAGVCGAQNCPKDNPNCVIGDPVCGDHLCGEYIGELPGEIRLSPGPYITVADFEVGPYTFINPDGTEIKVGRAGSDKPWVVSGAELMDVPAIPYKHVTDAPAGSGADLRDFGRSCVTFDGIWDGKGCHETFFTCKDKRRALIQSQDRKFHCILFPTEKP